MKCKPATSILVLSGGKEPKLKDRVVYYIVLYCIVLYNITCFNFFSYIVPTLTKYRQTLVPLAPSGQRCSEEAHPRPEFFLFSYIHIL